MSKYWCHLFHKTITPDIATNTPRAIPASSVFRKGFWKQKPSVSLVPHSWISSSINSWNHGEGGLPHFPQGSRSVQGPLESTIYLIAIWGGGHHIIHILNLRNIEGKNPICLLKLAFSKLTHRILFLLLIVKETPIWSNLISRWRTWGPQNWAPVC